MRIGLLNDLGRIAVWTFCMIACVLVPLTAQTVIYPESLFIPVTFYDYRADGTNPEFEQPMMGGGTMPGLVARALDPLQHKPKRGTIVAGSRNVNIEKWFRPWVADAQVPSYTAVVPTWADAAWPACAQCEKTAPSPSACNQYWNATITYNGMIAGASNAFENHVILDSLLFLLSDPANGTYVFDDQEFFPLDGKGFGNDAPYSLLNNKNDPGMADRNNWLTICQPHNFSFTMEMKRPFKLLAGQTFEFIGDDDLWVFINDTLALDIGGVHSQDTGRFSLDSLATANHLNPGSNYQFSLFYAERQSEGSHLKITTNLIAPARVDITTLGDHITAGQWLNGAVTATVVDKNGVALIVQPSEITWTLVAASSVAGDSVRGAGLSAGLYAERAWREIEVMASYRDPTGIVVSSTRLIRVAPGDPDHMVIEDLSATGDTVAMNNRNADWPVGHIYVTLQDVNKKAYAVLRDKFKNYVSLGSTAAWVAVNPIVVTVTPDAGRGYIGIITSPGVRNIASDSTTVTATQGGFTGSVIVVMQYKTPCALPVATPDDTSFRHSQQVTLSSATPGGADIYYCLNCVDPRTDPGRILYTAPFAITDSNATIVRAYATKTDPTFVASDTMSVTYTNLDWKGPGITSVYYFLGSLPNDAVQGLPDRLVVHFSEPVRCADLEQSAALSEFNFLPHSGGTNPLDNIPTNFIDSCGGGTLTTDSVTIYLTNVKQVRPGRDSLQIIGGAMADVWGNDAPTPGIKTVIQWGRDYELISTTYPVPFVPGTSQVHPIILKAIQDANQGVAIPNSAVTVAIKSIKRVDIGRSEARVYDALGNVIRNNLQVYKSTDDYQFYILWDARNSNNRIVGSGTYLAVIFIQEEGMSSRGTTYQKIGIKRE